MRGELESGRVQKLENVPGWKWDPLASAWEEGFRRLQEYVDENGSAAVPFAFTADDYKLGQWVVQQRQRKSKGNIIPDRASRLESLPGWTWDPNADRWETSFAAILEYVRDNGHARVPVAFRTGQDFRLGGWVAEQRTAYSEGRMSQDRKDRLEALPGWTWTVPLGGAVRRLK